MLSALYGTWAVQRRRWYEVRPHMRRRLSNPVISVGGLSVGGSGKTPIAADVAKVLVSLGESPALLSRGYRRTEPCDGVVVVSESGKIKTGVGQAGDEPYMLAGQLMDVSVLVCENRYLAGRLAESRLGSSVHLLDDGFQHLSLHRDIDLLVVGRDDLSYPKTLPGGKLREPLSAATRADAVIVEAPSVQQASNLADQLGIHELFHFQKRLGSPRNGVGACNEVELLPGMRVLVVAGIAKPESFVDAVRVAGYDVVDTIAVRDHHNYSRRDLVEINQRVKRLEVDFVVTTEKDIVRLCPMAPFEFPLVWMPLDVSVQPAELFRSWLSRELVRVRARNRQDL